MKKIAALFSGLRGKLLLAAIPSTIAFVAIGYMNYSGFHKLKASIDNIHSRNIPINENIMHLKLFRSEMLYSGWAALAASGSEREDYIQKLVKARESFGEYRLVYEKFLDTPEKKQRNEILNSQLAERIQLTNEIAEALRAHTPDKDAWAKSQLTGRWRDLFLDVEKVLPQEEINSDNELKESYTNISSLVDMQTNLTVFVTAGAIFGLIAVLVWLSMTISKSINALTARLASAGQSMTNAITQLSTAGESLSQNSAGAAASLEETVASLEEMTSMVKMNSDNAKQAAALSQASRDAAEQGEQEIHNLISSMNEISTSSKKIEEIINVIDDIAFQTNLLALNAAVEAARAGEQGKGFAVVAEAVRSLAQRSAVAAKDISGLIKESVEKIEKGTSIADESGAVLNNIVTSVKKVADLNNEIATASAEQTTGISQISKAMNQLDQSSQGNAASAEEIASTASEIMNQTKSMNGVVGELNDVILGDDPATTSSKPAKKKEVKSERNEKKTLKLVKSDSKKSPAPSKHQEKHEPTEFKSSPPRASSRPKGADFIPFDEDEPRAKVGTTDGF